MSDHYHDENDLKLMRDMRKLAPDDFNAWLGWNPIVGRDNGAMALKIFRPTGGAEKSIAPVKRC